MEPLIIRGESYRASGKLNAITQLHVVRRLGPALLVVGLTLNALREGLKPDMGDILAAGGPVVEMLANMKEEDFNYVTYACLGVIERQQDGKWAPVFVQPANKLMFADMDFAVLIRLIVAVLQENLASFWTELNDEVSSQSA